MDGIDALGRVVVVLNIDAVPPRMNGAALTYLKAYVEPIATQVCGACMKAIFTNTDVQSHQRTCIDDQRCARLYAGSLCIGGDQRSEGESAYNLGHERISEAFQVRPALPYPL